MSDVVVTAAEVLPDSGSNLQAGILGATVTAGQLVYLDTSTNTYKLADANSSAATATVAGIAMTGGVSGQPVSICMNNSTLDPGFTVTVGAVYVCSANAGGIAPVADLAQNWRTSIVGVGITASQLALRIYNSGATVP